jgi:flagellar hook-basal body complex protein FliE
MNIDSIQGLNSVNPLQQQQSTNSVQNTGSLFSDIYNSLINNVNSTDEALQGDIVKAAEGELDNPHQLVIDSTKANIALQLLLSVRNDALNAYNEIIKMSI